MKEAFAPGYEGSFSVRQLMRNCFFYKELPITSALRTQFHSEWHEKLSEENPAVGIKVIEGRER